jgi:tetratricopeptide (TPR) repeat protein
MIQRVQIFLGVGRLRALFAVIGATGLVSLILNGMVDQYDWVRPFQTILALGALVGGVIIVGSAFEREDRARYLAIIAPAVGALLLGLTVLPQYIVPLAGAALGWIVAGTLVFRVRAPMQYQQAVKALRKNQLADAVGAMDDLIKAEPNNPGHYRFRAELLRVWGKLERARRDYAKMIELEPDSPLAYNGLAEVELQAKRYEPALIAAQKAADLAPREWVALYNLGMIEDRLGRSIEVVGHLSRALELNIPDVRHRLLIHLYLARAHARIGDVDAARRALDTLKKQANGVREWNTILQSEQAGALREAIGADVEAARGLIAGEIDVMTLADEPAARPS